MQRYRTVGVAVVLASLAAAPAAAPRPPLSQKAPPPSRAKAAPAAHAYVPGQLIVSFRPGAGPAARSAAHAAAGGRVLKAIEPLDAALVAVPAGQEAAALAAYRTAPAVRRAERDTRLETGRVPNDPLFDIQWGLLNGPGTEQPPGDPGTAGADIDAARAWDLTLGKPSTRLAIVDTGIDSGHEDLAARVVFKGTLVTNIDAEDNDGHGTAVGGAAGAIPNNGRGVAGVAFRVGLMNIKVTDDYTGSIGCGAVANGIVFATDHSARVINISLGSAGDCFLLEDAVNYAWERDVLPIAAAGNEGTSQRQYPAAYDNAMSVAATDNDDRRASFSNFGASWVDIAAPGVSIATTLPRYPNDLGGTDYGYLDGTSFASPLVAGTAALIWPSVKDQNGDGFKSDDVALRLIGHADNIPGTGTLWRRGRLNACRAFAAGAKLCPPVAMIGALPKMTPKDAKRYARDALQRKFRKKFTQGTNRKNECERKSPTRFRCDVSWRHGGERYSGKVTPSYVRKDGTVTAKTPIAVQSS